MVFTRRIPKKLVLDSWLLVLSMGWKLMMKELIVALEGEICFVKFIINLEEDDAELGVIFGRSFLRTSSSAGGHLRQEEATKEALAIIISQKFALFEEERHIIETMAYHDKYKKILDEVWKDKVELDGKIVKEEEEAVKRIKSEALKEKDDPGAFIFPIRLEGQVDENALADTGSDINTMSYQIYEQLGREDIKNVDRGIIMINHTQAEAMGILTNVSCQVGVTTLIAKFLILDIPIDRNSPIVVGRGFLHTIGGITMGTHDDEAGSSRSKHPRQHETIEEVLLPQVHHEFLLWEGCNRDAKMGYDREIVDMLRIRLREARSDEEIFTSVAWIRVFNINEPIYEKLCHEFYSTYKFDEVCADDELQTKKIIKFRLGGRAHSLTLLEFARRLGLYQVVELEEEGFIFYFEGGLRSDDHFNAQDYWLSISREENLGLSRSHISTIKNPILRLLSMFDARHKNRYANVAWLIARWMKRKGAGTQKECQICCRQFISKIARKCRVLIEDVVRSLSALIYYRDLDTTTLRDLIDSEGRLIHEDPQPSVPRVGIPRHPRASMQDLYNRMGRMEIRQEAIERMEYREPTTYLVMLSRNDETIDCAFSIFNTIITSLKTLDESFSSRNHVRKFLRALPTKWRPKVTAIEEFKDLSKLSLDELIGKLKVYEVVLEKDSEISKNKKEKYKSLALKARKESSDEEASCSSSDDEEYAMAEGKKEKEDRRCFKCGDPNHFISDCPKHSFNDHKAFVVGCWSDSEEDTKKDDICLMALDNNEVLSDTPYYSSSSLDNESLQSEYDKLCKISLRLINKNKHLKAKNELLNNEACALKIKVDQLERNKEVSIKCETCVELRSKVNSLSLKLATFESRNIFARNA
ncbi:retrotransposon ORF1 [Tanacetum coccineum]